MNVLTNTADYNRYYGFFEALEFGGQMVLIGMLAVFAVLGLIWAMLSVFKLVFTKTEDKEKAPKAQATAPVVAAPAPVSSEGEIVAVLAAAVAMAESESDSGIKFRVVSFRKK